MSHKQDLEKFLNGFNQRTITKGEVVLTAYTFAMSIDLYGTSKTDDTKQVYLGSKLVFDRVVYTLREYMHINNDCMKDIEELCLKFLMWRRSILNGELCWIKGDVDMVIDDLSGITRTLSISELCPVGDEVNNAMFFTRGIEKLICVCEEQIEKEKVGE